MALALRAGTSARHLSFIETGRGHPNRALLLRLAGKLDVPLRARNALLDAAGYAPLYRETGLSDPEMGQVRRVLEFVLQATRSYPAMIIDRYWNILMMNPGMEGLIRVFVHDRDAFAAVPLNLMRIPLHPLGMRRYIVNGADTPCADPGIGRWSMVALLAELESYPPPEEGWPAMGEADPGDLARHADPSQAGKGRGADIHHRRHFGRAAGHNASETAHRMRVSGGRRIGFVPESVSMLNSQPRGERRARGGRAPAQRRRSGGG